jgi:hypothetical protein
MAKPKKKKKNPRSRSTKRSTKRAVKRRATRRKQLRASAGGIKKYTNPARSGPKNWVAADKVRVRNVGGKKVLEIFRKAKRRRR